MSLAENLACDEALLQQVENSGESWLRIWYPRTSAVVLGYANKVASEANIQYCRDHGIEINRRISGGGTVVLGNGCMCYSIAIPITANTPFQQVASTNRFIMETNRNALDQLTKDRIEVNGVSDLSIREKKFSGNSQKRGKHALLFHGSILFAADLDLIARCLRHPSSEPEWRQRRTHADFITNVPARDVDIEKALVNAWSAIAHSPSTNLSYQTDELVEKKYCRDHWRYCR